jgi:DNA-binding response OmpR family regulator
MKKILIIEDDQVLVSAYRQGFTSRGFSVATALDGQAGLDLLDTFRPDLVQVDLMVPIVSGVEVIQRIRARPGLDNLPIVVVSGCYVTEMVEAAVQAGATKVISKLNCSPRAVVETINEILTPNTPPAPPSPPPASSPSPSDSPAAPPESKPPLARTHWQQSATGSSSFEIRQGLLHRAGEIEQDLRNHLHTVLVSQSEPARLSALHELYRCVHSLTGYSGMAGFLRIAHVAGALELLLKDLAAKPRIITSSTLTTLSRAVESISRLFLQAPETLDQFPQSPLVLAVDDEPISRHTLGAALARANLRAIALDDPNIALHLLKLNRFDLVLLDVDMPGIDGFELCQRLHETPTNRQTPVIFVTALSDYEIQARSLLSGGQELIAKPYPLIELAVKALAVIAQH